MSDGEDPARHCGSQDPELNSGRNPEKSDCEIAGPSEWRELAKGSQKYGSTCTAWVLHIQSQHMFKT
jgi:hypothetical protein